MTSNLAADNNSIGFMKSKENHIHNKLNEYFSIEFVNRIDEILVLDDLDSDNIKCLIKQKLNELKNII